MLWIRKGHGINIVWIRYHIDILNFSDISYTRFCKDTRTHAFLRFWNEFQRWHGCLPETTYIRTYVGTSVRLGNKLDLHTVSLKKGFTEMTCLHVPSRMAARRRFFLQAQQAWSVRPPRWLDRGAFKTMTLKKLTAFKAKQVETLSIFRQHAKTKSWEKLHQDHFDWWMFPIDDGSKDEFNICSEEDVTTLRGDVEWLKGYHEALRLAAAAWGWDLTKACRIEPPETGMAWTNWDVRLAKMCRSLYLFEEEELLDSLQTFARDLQKKEKKGKEGFFYNTICLDELLYFQLPRKTLDDWNSAQSKGVALSSCYSLSNAGTVEKLNWEPGGYSNLWWISTLHHPVSPISPIREFRAILRPQKAFLRDSCGQFFSV